MWYRAFDKSQLPNREAIYVGIRFKVGSKKLFVFPFKFQSKVIKYSFLKYLFPLKEKRTLDVEIFRLHRRFRNLIFTSGDKGHIAISYFDFSASRCFYLRSPTYWIGNCIRRMEKRDRNDGKKSLVWVEMVLWGDLTMKYIHPFYHCRDLLLLLPRLRLKTERFRWHLNISTQRVEALYITIFTFSKTKWKSRIYINKNIYWSYIKRGILQWEI